VRCARSGLCATQLTPQPCAPYPLTHPAAHHPTPNGATLDCPPICHKDQQLPLECVHPNVSHRPPTLSSSLCAWAACAKICPVPSECHAAGGRDASCEERHIQRQGVHASIVHHDRMVNTVKVVHHWDGDGHVGWKIGPYAMQGVHFEIPEWWVNCHEMGIENPGIPHKGWHVCEWGLSDLDRL